MYKLYADILLFLNKTHRNNERRVRRIKVKFEIIFVLRMRHLFQDYYVIPMISLGLLRLFINSLGLLRHHRINGLVTDFRINGLALILD